MSNIFEDLNDTKIDSFPKKKSEKYKNVKKENGEKYVNLEPVENDVSGKYKNPKHIVREH